MVANVVPQPTDPLNVYPSRSPRERQDPIAYVYLAPVIFSAIVFTLIPFFYTLYIAFTNYNKFRHFKTFELVGFDNFKTVFATGSEFFPVLGWTAAFMVLTTFINVGFGAMLAMLLNYPHLRERNIFRTLLIIPWALPFILLIQVWGGLFNGDGPINRILGGLGISGPIWLGENSSVVAARAALLIANLWFTYPFFMTVCLAALQAIPRDLYEVADLDGAGSWARFKDITFPFLLKAITPLLITQAAFQFNNAGIIILLTNGRPLGSPGARYGTTDTLASYAYKLIFEQGRYGLAAAYSIMIFFVIAAFTIANARITGSFKEAI